MRWPSLRVPTVDRFCCTTLRSGCLIIGSCEIVMNIVSVVLVFTLRSHWQEAMFVTSVFSSSSPGLEIIDVFEYLRYSVSSILLSVGAVKSRPMFLIPWLFLKLESMYWEVLKMIITFTHLSSDTIQDNMVNFFVFLVTFSLCIYWWLVVYSFYRQLKSEQSFQRLGQTIAAEEGNSPVPESQLHGLGSLGNVNLVRNEIKFDP